MDSTHVHTISSTEFNPVLKQLKDGSLYTMENLSKTFAGMLIQFQQQLDKNKDYEERFDRITDKFSSIDAEIVKTNEKIVDAVEALEHKMSQQSAETDNKIKRVSDELDRRSREIREEIEDKTSQIRSECQLMINEISKQVQESLQSIDRISDQMEKCQDDMQKCIIAVDTISEKVDHSINEINDRQEKMENQLTQTKNTMNEKFFDVEEQMTANKKYANEQLDKVKGEMNEKFSNFDSQIEHLELNKADVNDLKRKADKTDFDELGETVSNIKSAFMKNVDEINHKMEENQHKIEEDISETKHETDLIKQDATTKFYNFGAEINKLNEALFGMERELQEKVDHVMENIGPDPQILEMMDELRARIEFIDEKIKIPVAGSTSSGSCFSCGKSVQNTFPALKPRKPLKANKKKRNSIGGGFGVPPRNTGKHRRKSKSHYIPDAQNFNGPLATRLTRLNEFSESMQKELGNMAAELLKEVEKQAIMPKKPRRLPSLPSITSCPV